MPVFSATVIAIALSRSLSLTGCLMPVAGAAFLTMQSAVKTGLPITTPQDTRGRVPCLGGRAVGTPRSPGRRIKITDLPPSNQPGMC